MDSLSNTDKVLLDTAKSLREDYLQQIAFDKVDTFSSIDKQYGMLKTILYFHDQATQIVEILPPDTDINEMFLVPVKKQIVVMKTEKTETKAYFEQIMSQIKKELNRFEAKNISLESHEDINKSINFLGETSELDN